MDRFAMHFENYASSTEGNVSKTCKIKSICARVTGGTVCSYTHTLSSLTTPCSQGTECRHACRFVCVAKLLCLAREAMLKKYSKRYPGYPGIYVPRFGVPPSPRVRSRVFPPPPPVDVGVVVVMGLWCVPPPLWMWVWVWRWVCILGI